MLTPELLIQVLKQLDEILVQQNSTSIDLKVCGGGALCILGISFRQTRDLDVIVPDLPEEVKVAAKTVAKVLNLRADWLNNGPASLVRDLQKGWEDRCEPIHAGRCVSISILGRLDLIASKLFAFCDRDENDLEDLVVLKPTKEELNSLLAWTLERDGSEYWPKRVTERFLLLGKKLGHV